jgi:SAM-dependent methyltransferase
MNDKDLQISDFWSSTESKKVQGYLKRAAGYDAADLAAVEDARLVDTFIAPRYAGKRVLDFGAGPGRLVQLWRRHDVQLTSTDWSASFLPVLLERSNRYGARGLSLDISSQCLDEQFDLVFSTQVLLHIHPRHVDAAMANIRRMAAADVILITWQSSPPFDDAACPKLQSFNHDYKRLFEKHGLQVALDLSLHFRATKSRGDVVNKVFYLTVTP